MSDLESTGHVNPAGFPGDNTLKNRARPVDLLRLMLALDALGLDYEVIEEDEEDGLLVSFRHFLVFLTIHGPLDPYLKLTVYLRAAAPVEREADLINATASWNANHLMPRVVVYKTSYGRWSLHMDHRVTTQEGLSDAQLQAIIKHFVDAAYEAIVDIAPEVPEIVGVPEGTPESFGETDTPFVKPVTLERLVSILEFLPVDGLEVHEGVNLLSFHYHGRQTRMLLLHDKRWLGVRSYLGLYGSANHHLQLAMLANTMNNQQDHSAVTIQALDDSYFLYMENNVVVADGMTPTQLFAAIIEVLRAQDAVSEQFADEIAEARRQCMPTEDCAPYEEADFIDPDDPTLWEEYEE